MLDDLHGQDHVEDLAAGCKRLGRGMAVIDVEPLLLGMDPRDGDVPLGRVGADDMRSKPMRSPEKGFGAVRSRPNSAAIWAVM